MRTVLMLLLALALALAQPPSFARYAQQLSRATWDRTIAQYSLVLVEFYTPSCPHCVAFAPAYEEAARRLKDHKQLLVATVDGNADPGLASDYKVEGFPTVLLLRKGEGGVFTDEPQVYKGERTAEALLSFLEEEALRPPSKELTKLEEVQAAVLAAAQRGRAVTVGLFDEEGPSSLEYSTWRGVATELRRTASFVHIHDARPGLLQGLGIRGEPRLPLVVALQRAQGTATPPDHLALTETVTSEAVLAPSPNPKPTANPLLEQRPHAYMRVPCKAPPSRRLMCDAPWQSIVEFVVAHRYPLFGEFCADSDEAYRAQKLPMAILFVDGVVHTNPALVAAAETVAARHTGRAVFVWARAADVGSSLERFNLSTTPKPALLVSYMADGAQRHYPLVGTAATEAKQIEEHVVGVLDGRLRPLRRSLPVPAGKRKPGAVVEVVGFSFGQEVLDRDKDVLVEMYAPWCQHCQAFAPQYEKAAKALRFVETLRVARFDATQNDPPEELATEFQADGYPAFRLVRAGDNAVVAYTGERSARALIQWAQAEARHTFSFDPVEVNFLANMESLQGLTAGVRRIFQENQELRREVERLKRALEVARQTAAEAAAPTEAGAMGEIAEKEKLGTMVRRERERVREAEAEHRQGEEKQYKQARRDEEGVEAEAERLVKEENRHQQAAEPKEL